MKKYIIIAGSISGMGGGQMYIYNKVRFMEEKGWKVEVFSSNGSEIYIQELKKFSENIIPKLGVMPFLLRRREVIETIQCIVDTIGADSENMIIESTTPVTSYWSEILAKIFMSKHVAFLLDEHLEVINKNYLPFFDFKHKRQELAGINQKSLIKLFRDYKNIKYNESFCLPAVCYNVVGDNENELFDKIEIKDFTIGSIGRLDKLYVLELMNDIKLLANKFKEYSFQVILVGGANDEKVINSIQNVVNDVKNVSLIITGYIYPIPKKLFKMVDVFVSSAGSARVSYMQDVPTITIDANDNKAIGILGYTTTDTLYRPDNSDIFDISYLLEEILINKKLINLEYKQCPSMPGIEFFETHMEFWQKSSKSKKYYEINNLKLSSTDKIKKIIISFIGYKFYRKLTDFIKEKF